MSLALIVLFVSVLYGSDAYNLKQCSDCKFYRACPEAIHFSSIVKDEEIKTTKLKSSICGVEKINGIRMPKVCCSDYISTDDPSVPGLIGQIDSKERHANALLPEECGRIDGQRIIGGSIANLYEFPWMALISHRTRSRSAYNDLYFKCGGSIINSRYILTAAHCVFKKMLYKVRVGELDLSSKEDCQGEYPNYFCEAHIQDIEIEESIPHEKYQRMPSKNDIALLRLKQPIEFGHKNVAPICLPVLNELRNISLVGREGTIAGWGTTDSGSKSATLRKVDIPILTASDCFEQKTETTPNQFCAGELGKDSCDGDSGGPFMVENKANGKYRMIQYGIVSYGPKICGTATPGVYTNVVSYMDWILSNMKP
ncbi:CLIP domain-containing serine protease 14D-like [Vanessa cardui]|uniref:CLIP domain-containing serine protease 14D-like n=1 Tax=Vanessa cardui TaxID=171605 RepID=UPI001F13D61C|nr:CLIP domain-containing serine protease 14D-like [Vanessa cardui]